jgi:bifunctional DNase/RNase
MTCYVSNCGSEAFVQVMRCESRRVVFEAQFCETHGEQFFRTFRATGWARKQSQENLVDSVCTDIELIAVTLDRTEKPVAIYLREIDGCRRMATMSGWHTWDFLADALHGTSQPRPLAHRAWLATIASLGATLRYVKIDIGEVGRSWRDTSFSGCIMIEDSNHNTIEVPVIASDAYALAILLGVNIFVTNRLMSHAGEVPQSS